MADIDNALRELRSTLISIKIFDVVLASLIVMAAALVVTTYFKFDWYYALIPAALYFAYGFVRRVNVNSYHEVEDKVPQLREALQTAADTRKSEGILVRELQLEVLEKMRAIKTSYFLAFGTTTRQLLLISGLAFIVIGLSAFNVNFDSTKEFIGKQAFVQDALGSIGEFAPVDNNTVNGKITNGKTALKTTKFVKLQGNNSLYGAEGDVTLGESPLQITIDPEMSGSNLKDAQPAETKKFTDQEAGSIEASAQAACTSDCNIPKDQQQIVKSYFEKVGSTE